MALFNSIFSRSSFEFPSWMSRLGFGPVVADRTANQIWVVGQDSALVLAANTFTDPLGLAMTYRATLANGAALPSWLRFDATTRRFTGTAPGGIGSIDVQVVATDTLGLSGAEQFKISFTGGRVGTGAKPVLTAQTPNQIWAAGVASSVTLAPKTFTDPQGAALTYSASLADGSALPAWLTFNATTGVFSGTDPAGTAPISIKVTATDTLGLSASEVFSIALAVAPKLTVQTANQFWVAGRAQTFALAANTFVDPQGAALTYSATLADGSTLPGWLKFNAGTRSFSGIDPAGSPPVTIKVTARDTYGLQSSESFTLSLAAAPFVASQTPTQSWVQGQPVSFILPKGTFTDPQGAPFALNATLANGTALPGWLKFNSITGRFTGTEPAGTTGFSIKVTATDIYGLSASETFAVATPAPAGPTPAPASGMVINITYDSSTAAAPTGFFTAVQAAVNFIKAEFTNPITLNLKFGYGSVNGSTMGAGALGASQTSYNLVNYATLRAALASHATQPDQLTALASLPATSPVGGANFIIANAEAKALGLATANTSGLDGSIGVSSLYAMTWDPNNRAVGGLFDAIGVLEHEITEVMGRTGSLGVNSAAYTAMDLFRYTGPGVRDLVPGAGYFSIDGQTMLQAYNNPLNGGDTVDWAPSVVGDSFGSGRAGVAGLVTEVDLKAMNVLGYTRASLTS